MGTGRERDVRALRVGIVGCGFATADRHLPALAKVSEVAVVALADLDEARCHAVAERFGVRGRHTSAEELIARPDVDAVAVCTVASSHAAIALAALDAGKHVFVEKPLALSLADADALVARARDAARATMVGFNLRRHRTVENARALLADGRLGRVTAVASTYTDALVRPERPAWRGRRADGGGAVLEKLVHHVDLWRHLLADEVDEVFALSSHRDAEDEVAVVAARMRGGALVHALASDRTSVANELVVYGDAGSLRLDLYRFDGLELSSPDDLPGSPRTRGRRAAASLRALVRHAGELRSGGLFDATYAAEWRAFAHAARTGAAHGSTFEDGRSALEVSLAALASASSGAPVRVTEAPATVPAVGPA